MTDYEFEAVLAYRDKLNEEIYRIMDEMEPLEGLKFLVKMSFIDKVFREFEYSYKRKNNE